MIRWTIRIMLAFELAWLIAPPVAAPVLETEWHCAPDGFCARIENRGAGQIDDRR